MANRPVSPGTFQRNLTSGNGGDLFLGGSGHQRAVSPGPGMGRQNSGLLNVGGAMVAGARPASPGAGARPCSPGGTLLNPVAAGATKNLLYSTSANSMPMPTSAATAHQTTAARSDGFSRTQAMGAGTPTGLNR